MIEPSFHNDHGVRCANAISFDRGSIAKRNILKADVETIAIEKYQSSGYGLTYSDIQGEFSVDKKQAQRNLKYFHGRKVLFTARDLICQDIHLLENKNPQQFFPSCIKADIIDKLKKRKRVLDDFELQPLSKRFRFRKSNLLEEKKAQTLLETLLLLAYIPIYIHKLQLKFHINKDYYAATKELVGYKRIDTFEEIIGSRHVRYILSPNGTIQVFIRSNDAPFRLESELDESIIFSFFGQVKDRLLYILGDVKELVVPSVMEWKLMQCDVNKDVEIDEKAQLTLPDIQLKVANRVFREYVKIMQGTAYYRVEESLKLNEILPVALDNIRHPVKNYSQSLIKDLKKTDVRNRQTAIFGKRVKDDRGHI